MNASVHSSQPASQPDPAAFHRPTPADYAWARPLLFAAGRQGCEYSFGNLYAWCVKYGTEIARAEGFFLLRCLFRGQAGYGFPVGPGDLSAVLPLLEEDASSFGAPLRLFGVTREDIPRLEAARPGAFRFETDRADWDYIYARADLAELAGKKYHQKRNHVARFERNYDWRYEEITPAILDECLDMERQWEALHSDRDPEGLRLELAALERCLEQYEAFDMRGGALRAGGKLVAFTVGEALNATTFCTHFEKAYPDYPGAYQMINRCFAQRSLSEFEYVNREEDLGDEGLRRAKLSYYPVTLLEKYTATEEF